MPLQASVAQLARLLEFDESPPSSQASIPEDAWDDLTVAAIALGLAPLLFQRVEQFELPGSTRARLAVTYAAQAQRSRAIAGQLGELLAACAGAGIEVMVLKGGFLAFQVYPDPALRGMSDLDLLFRPDDLAAGESVLRSLGYVGKHKPADEGPGIVKHTSTFLREGNEDRAGTPNPYLSAGGDRHVDPHGSLEESWFGLRVDVTPGVWQRSRPVSLAGQPARAQSPEDLLLHLAVHLIFHLLMGKPSLVQLYDLGVVAERLSLDWDALVARSRSCQATPFLYAALHLATVVFSAPVPQPVLVTLREECPPGLARRIQAMSLADVLRQTQRPPLVSLRQRLARGVRERRETAAWATGWQGKWAVWRTALAVGRTDTGRLIGQRLRGAASESPGPAPMDPA